MCIIEAVVAINAANSFTIIENKGCLIGSLSNFWETMARLATPMNPIRMLSGTTDSSHIFSSSSPISNDVESIAPGATSNAIRLQPDVSKLLHAVQVGFGSALVSLSVYFGVALITWTVGNLVVAPEFSACCF